MIHLKHVADVYSAKYCWIWLLSAFKAGFLNSAGFLITGNFVSHVTGFGTQIGMAIGDQAYFYGVELLVIPFFFILGGVITAYVLEDEKVNCPPSYHIIQGLITVFIGIVVLMGEYGLVDFHLTHKNDPYGLFELMMIALLCLICGLKNSLITWSTKGKVRVTHLTGLSTDIGLNLLKTFKNDEEGKETRVINLMRIFTFLFFSIGACSSAMIFPALGYKVFLVVMAISLVMTIVSLVDRRKYIISCETSKKEVSQSLEKYELKRL